MNKIKQSIDVIDAITGLMSETQEETETRRKEAAERREEESSDYQNEMKDCGLCNADFL